MQSFRSGPANLGAAGLGRKAMQTRPLAPPSHHARVPARARGAALRWCKPGQKYPARVEDEWVSDGASSSASLESPDSNRQIPQNALNGARFAVPLGATAGT